MGRFVERKKTPRKNIFQARFFIFSPVFYPKLAEFFFEIYTGKHDSALVTLQTKTKKQEGYLHNSLQKKAGQPSHDATAQLMFTTNYCFLLALSFSAQALQSSYLYSFFFSLTDNLCQYLLYIFLRATLLWVSLLFSQNFLTLSDCKIIRILTILLSNTPKLNKYCILFWPISIYIKWNISKLL